MRPLGTLFLKFKELHNTNTIEIGEPSEGSSNVDEAVVTMEDMFQKEKLSVG